jgi:predicted NAD/FAD-binding protein
MYVMSGSSKGEVLIRSIHSMQVQILNNRRAALLHEQLRAHLRQLRLQSCAHMGSDVVRQYLKQVKT